MKRLICLLSLLASMGTPACDGATKRIQTRCERAGDKCRLKDGLLGICSETTGCAEPPCVACMPQH